VALSEGRRASLWLFGPALLWLLGAVSGVGLTLLDERAWSAVDRRVSSVEGSERCLGCHRAEHASWRRSYHRTMTQRAEGDALLAPFAGETLDSLGFRATMSRNGEGRPHIRIERLEPWAEEDPLVLDVDVELTVGSHRYQQYMARIDRGGGSEELWRLPVAWHVELDRWIHINDAFLTPEGQWGEQEDYLRHLARWNDNCIFCHNTEPVPGLDEAGHWQSRVGELGIGCEACHGPGSAHVERHGSLLRRLLAVGDRGEDASIAHPGRLGAGGDGFLPGHPLSEVSRPIEREATLEGQSGTPFAPRFWPDGTPRLSAYEYQALRLSPCYLEGEGLGCGDCHTMHGPEPAMQLRSSYDIIAVCGDCHPSKSLSDASAPGGHGRHGAVVDCQGCHLPRTTYGLLEGMMSHRIRRPRPQDLRGRDDQPDACTQCHVDRSRAWAADALVAWAEGLEPRPPAADELSRVVLDLHGGDPIQRALAAHALARSEAVVDPSKRMAWLVDALQDDYPAIRWFGYRGLLQLARREGISEVVERLDDPGVMDDPGLREVLVQELRARLGPGALEADPERLQALHERRDDRAIWIGE